MNILAVWKMQLIAREWWGSLRVQNSFNTYTRVCVSVCVCMRECVRVRVCKTKRRVEKLIPRVHQRISVFQVGWGSKPQPSSYFYGCLLDCSCVYTPPSPTPSQKLSTTTHHRVPIEPLSPQVIAGALGRVWKVGKGSSPAPLRAGKQHLPHPQTHLPPPNTLQPVQLNGWNHKVRH